MNPRILLRLLLSMMVFSTLMLLSIQEPAAAADEEWHARYWNNRKLEGEPVLQRFERTIDYDWGHGYPAPDINRDEFSVKWTRDVEFPEGTYRFFATTDDGMRVWVDEKLLIDSWYDSQVRTTSADRFLSAGKHSIRVEYYEAGGEAVAKFSWSALGGQPQVFNNWKGEYYNNNNLTSPALYLRDDPAINFEWGLNPPISGFDADNFSARWTRTLNFPAGHYRFNVRVDDGVRLWVNNRLIIDEWRDQTDADFSAEIDLPGGPVPLKLEYYESRDKAYVVLNWSPNVGAPIQQIATTLPAANQPATITDSPSAEMTGALYLNVREEPSMDGEVIGTLSRGQVVALTGYRSPGGYWLEIYLPDGSPGWVSTHFMTPSVPVSSLLITNKP